MVDSLPSLCLFTVVFLFLTTSTLSETTGSPNQDEPTYVFLKYKQKSANLKCPLEFNPPFVLKWLKEDVVIDMDDEQYSHFSNHTDNRGSTLTITNPSDKDIANYSCQLFDSKNFSRLDQSNKNYIVLTDLVVRMEDAVTVIEGDELKLKCSIVSKSHPYQISWSFGNTTYHTSGDRVKLTPDEKNIPNAIFIIDHSLMSDRGSYKCIVLATSTSNATEAETYVRVKDKYAALWPFLGICAEVIVLCTIILIYEKKRNKAELEESDTDQSPDQKNTPDLATKDTVRQRK